MSEPPILQIKLVYCVPEDGRPCPDPKFSDIRSVILDRHVTFETLRRTFDEFATQLRIVDRVTMTSFYHPPTRKLVEDGGSFSRIELVQGLTVENPVVLLEVNRTPPDPGMACGDKPFKINIMNKWLQRPLQVLVKASSRGRITFENIVKSLHEYSLAAGDKGMAITAIQCVKPIMRALYPGDVGIECYLLNPWPAEGNLFAVELMRADTSVYEPAPGPALPITMVDGGRTSSFGGRSGQSRRRSRSRGGRNGRVRSRAGARSRSRGGARSRSRGGARSRSRGGARSRRRA